MKKIAWLLFLAVSFSGSPAFAKLKIVTTLPSFADIVRNVGGEDVKVVALTRGTQDPHFVDAKPDLILDLRNADLLIHAGLGLEDGWLPSLLTGSRNGKIQTGSAGNLPASSVIPLKEVPRTPLDRSMGDVHPGGNPHFMVDPRNGVILAKAIAARLGQLDSEKAPEFEKRAQAYVNLLNKKIIEWDAELRPFAGTSVVTYHKSWLYFSEWAGLKEVGFVEPKPGIPPSPDHVSRLLQLMKDKKVKLILMEPFYPKGTVEQVAKLSGAKLLVLPAEVNGSPQAKTYVEVFEELVNTLKAALR